MPILSAVPYSFTPGTTILSGQVNSDFTSIVNGVNSGAAENAVNSSITSLTGLSQTQAILGTNTNNSASGGYVGEVLTADVPTGSALSVTSNVAKDIVTLSLTAGDWDVQGQLSQNANTALGTTWSGWLNTSSASAPAAWETSGAFSINGGASQIFRMSTGVVQFLLSSTTTIYLTTSFGFSSGTCAIYGFLRARRMR